MEDASPASIRRKMELRINSSLKQVKNTGAEPGKCLNGADLFTLSEFAGMVFQEVLEMRRPALFPGSFLVESALKGHSGGMKG